MLGVPIVALSIPPSATSAEIRDGRVKSADSEIISSLSSSKEVTSTSNSTSSTPLPPRRGIYLSIPLRFLTTSPFILDDGTPRIVQVTSTICIAHTGVGADGRALCDVAVKLALDYRYIYGEEISLEELLEGIAENIQERTMKGGSRPYGCALLIGCLGSGDNDGQPMMYRVDPSGAVVLLNPVSYEETSRETTTTIEGSGKRRSGSVAFLGNWDPLRQKKDAIRSQLETQPFANEEELQDVLVDVARQTYVDEVPLSEGSVLQSTKKRLNQPVLFASFTHERGLQISRITRQPKVSND